MGIQDYYCSYLNKRFPYASAFYFQDVALFLWLFRYVMSYENINILLPYKHNTVAIVSY